MPPKTKAPTTNGSAKTPLSTGTSTNGTSTPKEPVPDASVASGRPDKKLYDTEQDKFKADIEALQVKLSAVRDKISLATNKSGPGNDKRSELRSELDSLREKQASGKSSRSKILEQKAALLAAAEKKKKDLDAAKGKIRFKNVAEVDAHIKQLEKQVDSGNMKLADEKRALQEISLYKRNRRTVEAFQADQDAIDADRRAAAELSAQLDDPEAKALSERYDAIKQELDKLKAEGDEAYAGRSKLFAERDSLQADINNVYNQKRESAAKFKDANDRYWTKVNEDRARRAERVRAERAAQDAQRKRETAERIREEAETPAFQADVEDCQTLIDFFSGKTTEPPTFERLAPKEALAGVPKLEVRQVESAPEGLVARKKKGEDEESYFVGGKGKGKGNKKGPKSPNPETSSAQVNIPFSTLSALLSLAIPPPASPADFSRVVDDLKTKKSWYEANQARVTAENIAKAEADIKRLTEAEENKVDSKSPPAATSTSVNEEQSTPSSDP